jgi:hypothetical protein
MIEKFIVVLSEDYVVASIVSSVSLLLCMGCRRCISNVHSELFVATNTTFVYFMCFILLYNALPPIYYYISYIIYSSCVLGMIFLFCTFSSFAYFVLAFF